MTTEHTRTQVRQLKVLSSSTTPPRNFFRDRPTYMSAKPAKTLPQWREAVRFSFRNSLTLSWHSAPRDRSTDFPMPFYSQYHIYNNYHATNIIHRN